MITMPWHYNNKIKITNVKVQKLNHYISIHNVKIHIINNADSYNML